MKILIAAVVFLLSFIFISCKESAMNKLGQPYTLGTWTVKPGSEVAFIKEWKAFADWTAKNQPGAAQGFLVQDPDHPQQFVSFGPWDSLESINAWRGRAEFRTFVAKAKSLCEGFQPQTLKLVASSQ